MKYSVKCLEKALGIILTDYDVMKKHVKRLAALDMAAKQLFLYPDKFKETTEQSFAAFIIHKALLELAETGCLETGNVDEFWG